MSSTSESASYICASPKGIAWTGQYLALMDRGVFSPPQGNPGGAYIMTANPRIHLYDPLTRMQVRSIEIPVGLGLGTSLTNGVAWDGQYLWSAAYYLNSTYRTDLDSGLTTVFPRLIGSDQFGSLTWYDGSLWTKAGLSIVRCHPTTGALLGTWSLPSSGDTTSYNRGITALGGGRFEVSAGTTEIPQIQQVDTGMRGWLGVSPTAVEVPAGQTVSVMVSIDIVRTPAVTTTVILRVWSNDVDAREVQVPVTFTVGDLRMRAINLNRTPAYEWDALEPADAVVDPAGPSSQTVRVQTGQTAIVAPVTVSGG